MLYICRTPQVGFQRWLHLLANHDWKMLPIIVNLNNELNSQYYNSYLRHLTEYVEQI